jgi:hypothetical protein
LVATVPSPQQAADPASARLARSAVRRRSLVGGVEGAVTGGT